METEKFALNWELDTTRFDSIDFDGYEAEYKMSDVTGSKGYIIISKNRLPKNKILQPLFFTRYSNKTALLYHSSGMGYNN